MEKFRERNLSVIVGVAIVAVGGAVINVSVVVAKYQCCEYNFVGHPHRRILQDGGSGKICECLL